jgi:hypothetical protein
MPVKLTCERCGNAFIVNPAKIRERKHCSLKCYWEAKKGIDRKLSTQGYILVRMPDHPRACHNGFVQEHTLVVEKRLGRYLTRKERVHHDNEIRTDNRDSNLILCANEAEHRSIHRRKRISLAGGNPDTDRICPRCDKVKSKSEFTSSSNPYCRICYHDYRNKRGYQRCLKFSMALSNN